MREAWMSPALLRFKKTLETELGKGVPDGPYSLRNLATVTYLPPDHAVVKVGSDAYLFDATIGKAVPFRAGWEDAVFGPRGGLAKGLPLEDEGSEN